MRKLALLIALFGLGCLAPMARASDIFVANTNLGAANGSSCADARAASSLSGSDYTSGNRIRACGTITGAAGSTIFTVLGNNITILFESGAILQAPYFANTGGAINCNGHSNVTVDGGTNGLIRNTADGTAQTYQQGTTGVDGGTPSCTGFTVKNLRISNGYIRTQNSTDGVDSAAIKGEGNNFRATNNIIDHWRIGVFFGYQSSSGVEIDHNFSSFTEVAVIIGDLSGGASLPNARVHDNDWGGGAYLWDSPINNWHHNAIHAWSVQASTTGFTGLMVYNNFIHGVWNVDVNDHISSLIYLETIGDNSKVFNNRIWMLGAHNVGDNGQIFAKVSETPAQSSRFALIVNNTVVGDNTGGFCHETSTTGTVFKNNICSGHPYAVYTPDGENTTTINANHNLYYQATTWGIFDSFGGWQSHGLDLNGVIGNPLLDSNLAPTTGSPALFAGENLSSLGIPELNVDCNGNPRPTTGPWPIGACNSSGTVTTTRPNPPTGVSAVPH